MSVEEAWKIVESRGSRPTKSDYEYWRAVRVLVPVLLAYVKEVCNG